MNKIKAILTILLTVCLFLSVNLFLFFKEDQTYSNSERRALTLFPTFNKETLFSGKFANNYESYLQDQFPYRDQFRSIKAYSAYHLFQQLDNNGLYYKDGYLSKLEYPLNIKMLNNAANKFNAIIDTYLKDTDTKLYFSIVPDKNYFLAQDTHLSFDYDVLVNTMVQKMDRLEYINLFPLLSIEDYYFTDTHWRQEKIVDVSVHLLEKMGTMANNEYFLKKVDVPFYGVYVGQAAIDIEADELFYLTNSTLENCQVISYSSGKAKEIEMISLEKAQGKDGYEMFLNGTEALITIENQDAQTEKELILFRDSFGSSLAPLLVNSYRKITIIDTRYISPGLIGDYVEFNNQDVLFLYSTLLLNSSTSLK